MKFILLPVTLLILTTCGSPTIDQRQVHLDKINKIKHGIKVKRAVFGDMPGVQYDEVGFRLLITKLSKSLYESRKEYLYTESELMKMAKNPSNDATRISNDSLFNELIRKEVNNLEQLSMGLEGEDIKVGYKALDMYIEQIDSLNEECKRILI